MAFVNDSKNSSTVTNDVIASAGLTWNDMTQSWDEVEGTWDNPREAWAKDSKNTSTVANDAKL